MNSEEKSERGMCPMISGQLAPVQETNSVVASSGMMALRPMLLECQGQKCAWWSVSRQQCAIHAIGELTGLIGGVGNVAGAVDFVADKLSVFKPPKGSPSPIMRIAEALETILEARNLKPKTKD